MLSAALRTLPGRLLLAVGYSILDVNQMENGKASFRLNPYHVLLLLCTSLQDEPSALRSLIFAAQFI